MTNAIAIVVASVLTALSLTLWTGEAFSGVFIYFLLMSLWFIKR